MRTEIIYYADDGTRFENEDECKKYELEQKSKEATILAYDENLHLIQDWQNDLDHIMYVYCPTKQDIKVFNDFSNWNGMMGLPIVKDSDTGEYYKWFEWATDDYVVIDRKDLEEQFNKLKTILNLMDTVNERIE